MQIQADAIGIKLHIIIYIIVQLCIKHVIAVALEAIEQNKFLYQDGTILHILMQ